MKLFSCTTSLCVLLLSPCISRSKTKNDCRAMRAILFNSRDNWKRIPKNAWTPSPSKWNSGFCMAYTFKQKLFPVKFSVINAVVTARKSIQMKFDMRFFFIRWVSAYTILNRYIGRKPVDFSFVIKFPIYDGSPDKLIKWRTKIYTYFCLFFLLHQQTINNNDFSPLRPTLSLSMR